MSCSTPNVTERHTRILGGASIEVLAEVTTLPFPRGAKRRTAAQPLIGHVAALDIDDPERTASYVHHDDGLRGSELGALPLTQLGALTPTTEVFFFRALGPERHRYG